MAENAAIAAKGSSDTRSSLSALLAPSLGLIVVFVLLSWVFNHAMDRTGGEFTYPLDDSYIHLALAKNLAAHGVWGATPYEAAAASSSPLWTALLALCFKIFGNNLLIPLALNFILAIGTYILVMRLAVRWVRNTWTRSAIALFLLLALPVSVLVFNGMEHMLHVFLTLLFLSEMLVSLEDDRHKVHFLRLFVLGFLMALTRYESLFLFVVPLFLAWRKRRIELVAPMLGGIAGVSFFGVISLSMGLPFLPNTLLVKSDYGASGDRIAALLTRFGANFSFLLPLNIGLLAAAVAAFFYAKRFRPALLTMVGALLLHYAFADVQWGFFRYEAYLIAGMLFVICLILVSTPGWKPRAIIGVGLAFTAYRLFYRLMLGTMMMPVGMGNIHDQQFQMAKFINKYYPNAHVALIDVGAVGYYTDAHIIDLCGLASNDVRAMRVEHKLTQEGVDKILHDKGADFAIVHAYFFRPIGGFPSYMAPIVGWQIPNNVTCGADTITFYTPPANAPAFVRSLKDFAPSLPKGVRIVPPQR